MSIVYFLFTSSIDISVQNILIYKKQKLYQRHGMVLVEWGIQLSLGVS